MNAIYLEVHHRAEDVCALKAGQSTAALVNTQHTDEKQKMATPKYLEASVIQLPTLRPVASYPWNGRSTKSGKWEAVRQEMARKRTSTF